MAAARPTSLAPYTIKEDLVDFEAQIYSHKTRVSLSL